ncbi:MAG: hypothetical protein ACLQDC_06815, partial [Verrucomicrobiia bacterium]
TLDCSGAHIVSLGVYALRADDLKIDGNVLLRYGFIADGLVRLQPRDQFLPQPYEQLASVLKKAGRDEDAREILIAKNEDRAGRTKLLVGEWWWYGFFGKAIGYGYRPVRALKISILVIAVGFVIFRFGRKAGLLTRTEGATREGHVKFNAFFYSLETFVPLVNLHLAEHWLPDADRRMGSALRFYRWIHIIAGWILTTLLLGALVGLIRT